MSVRWKKKPPALKHWTVSSELIKGEKHNYHIFKVDAGDATTMEELTSCKNWYMEMSKHRENYKDHVVEEEADNTVKTDDEF